MLVHALGNSVEMQALMNLADKHRLVVIEDVRSSLPSCCTQPCSMPLHWPYKLTVARPLARYPLQTCESLGSRHGGKLLGTHGHFGTYSFYYSHHITSVEGGAVVSSIRDDGTVCQTLRALRAHGWTREFSAERKAAVQAAHADVDPRFLFVHWGFNVRPMETQAAMASIQLKRLEGLNMHRRDNFHHMRDALSSHRHIVTLPKASPGCDAAWFGLVLLLAAPYAHQQAAFFQHLAAHGVETRPVI